MDTCYPYLKTVIVVAAFDVINFNSKKSFQFHYSKLTVPCMFQSYKVSQKKGHGKVLCISGLPLSLEKDFSSFFISPIHAEYESDLNSIGASVRHSSGRRSGGCLVFFQFPPSRPFLIEGVLGSKN